MLLTTALAVALFPFVCLGAVLYDLVRFRRRLPTLRVYLFVLQYGINDSVEILLAPIYWLIAGFGRHLQSTASIRRHERLQRWSIDVLARRAEQLLGVRVALESADSTMFDAGPAIVVCRHVSLLDASLPALLYQAHGFQVRGVLMAELLADPGFDLLYGRTGSIFVQRDNGPEAQPALSALGRQFNSDTIAVIFPEGRLFRPELLQRFVERMSTANPERAKRLAGLRHVLPPRAGGLVALLAGAPEADVVVIAHAGLDYYRTLRELHAGVPLAGPISVTAWRIPRHDIPADGDAQARWLDDQWLRVDAWIADRLADTG